ncbi:hypothetical protein [Streptomyces sp. enrichment culture]|uniref:hypothetical protein n=1 Tax=Streptomyces sp. enrichment culture TaxID=1795815 RepID=UPI003F572D5E
MTDPTLTPDLSHVLERLEDQQRAHREQLAAVDHALNSPAAAAIARYLQNDGNGVSFRDFLREIGGALRLVDYVQDDRPDPARINPVIDRVFNRSATKLAQGGILITTTPTHPVTRL